MGGGRNELIRRSRERRDSSSVASRPLTISVYFGLKERRLVTLKMSYLLLVISYHSTFAEAQSGIFVGEDENILRMKIYFTMIQARNHSNRRGATTSELSQKIPKNLKVIMVVAGGFGPLDLKPATPLHF